MSATGQARAVESTLMPDWNLGLSCAKPPADKGSYPATLEGTQVPSGWMLTSTVGSKEGCAGYHLHHPSLFLHPSSRYGTLMLRHVKRLLGNNAKAFKCLSVTDIHILFLNLLHIF